jgi:hypothetical protein
MNTMIRPQLQSVNVALYIRSLFLQIGRSVIVVCTNSIIVLENKVQNMFERAVRFIYLSVYDVITTDTYISACRQSFPLRFSCIDQRWIFSFNITDPDGAALTVFLVLRASPTAT